MGWLSTANSTSEVLMILRLIEETQKIKGARILIRYQFRPLATFRYIEPGVFNTIEH